MNAQKLMYILQHNQKIWYLQILPTSPLLLHTPLQATEVISKLYAAHQGGDKNSGFDNEGEGAAVKDVVAAGILDLYLAKWWGIKLATGAAVTVLRVDQVCRLMCSLSHSPSPPSLPPSSLSLLPLLPSIFSFSLT